MPCQGGNVRFYSAVWTQRDLEKLPLSETIMHIQKPKTSLTVFAAVTTTDPAAVFPLKDFSGCMQKHFSIPGCALFVTSKFLIYFAWKLEMKNCPCLPCHKWEWEGTRWQIEWQISSTDDVPTGTGLCLCFMYNMQGLRLWFCIILIQSKPRSLTCACRNLKLTSYSCPLYKH